MDGGFCERSIAGAKGERGVIGQVEHFWSLCHNNVCLLFISFIAFHPEV
jgi:hypothetical protein